MPGASATYASAEGYELKGDRDLERLGASYPEAMKFVQQGRANRTECRLAREVSLRGPA